MRHSQKLLTVAIAVATTLLLTGTSLVSAEAASAKSLGPLPVKLDGRITMTSTTTQDYTAPDGSSTIHFTAGVTVVENLHLERDPVTPIDSVTWKDDGTSTWAVKQYQYEYDVDGDGGTCNMTQRVGNPSGSYRDNDGATLDQGSTVPHNGLLLSAQILGYDATDTWTGTQWMCDNTQPDSPQQSGWNGDTWLCNPMHEGRAYTITKPGRNEIIHWNCSYTDKQPQNETTVFTVKGKLAGRCTGSGGSASDSALMLLAAQKTPAKCWKVKLSVGDPRVALIKNENLKAEIVETACGCGLPDVKGATYTFEWSRRGEGKWTELHSGKADSYRYKPKIAGLFDVRVTAKLDGEEHDDSQTMTVRFPTISEIEADPLVAQTDQDTWNEGIAEVQAGQPAIEHCYLWALNTATGEYAHSPVKSGTNLRCPVPAKRPADKPANPSLTDAPAYWVAVFHTHPASVGRMVGAGPNDQPMSASLELPGILVDYVPTGSDAAGNPGIGPTEPITSATQVDDIVPPHGRPVPGDTGN